MMTFSVKWRYQFVVNGKPQNWREKLAAYLRKLAGRVDGRVTAAIKISTHPDIGRQNKARCINKGFEHAQRMIEGEVKIVALERAMRLHMPQLYDAEQEMHDGA